MPTVGQIVLYRTSETRTTPALVTKVLGSELVNLVAAIDAPEDWPVTNIPSSHPTWLYTSAAAGPGVGQWQAAELPASVQGAIDAAVAAGLLGGGFATTAELAAVAQYAATQASNVGLASAAALAEAIATREAVAEAGTSPTLALNQTRTPNATRPVRVTATGTLKVTSTLLLAQSAVVELRSDAQAVPAVVRGEQHAELSGVIASMTVPWCLTYDVPAGHSYRLVTIGDGTVTLLSINETVG